MSSNIVELNPEDKAKERFEQMARHLIAERATLSSASTEIVIGRLWPAYKEWGDKAGLMQFSLALPEMLDDNERRDLLAQIKTAISGLMQKYQAIVLSERIDREIEAARGSD